MAAGSDPRAWISEHRLLRDRAAHDLGFRTDILSDVATGPLTDQLVVLTGPRRIGKSVTLLDTAAALCARDDVDPRQIIHFACDGMRERDLRRSLTLGRELTRSVDNDRKRQRIWLLDKLFLTDPLLSRMPSRLRAGLATPDMTKLTENAIGTCLARAVDHLDEGRWLSGDTIGYTRTASGNEIDLAPVPSSPVPLDSRWIDRGWRGEARTLDAKYGRGILATKTILDTSRRTWAVPAPLLAAAALTKTPI